MPIKSVMPSNNLSSVVPFFSCLQSFPASGSFQMSQFFASGGQSIEVSASASVLPMNIQDWSPLGLADLISLQSKGLSWVFSNTTRASILRCSVFFIVQLSHAYMTIGKTIALIRQTCLGKVILKVKPFNILSRLVIAFLPRSKHLLISWLQSPSAVILEPKKTKSVTVSTGYILYQFTFPPTVHEDSFSPHPHQHLLFVVFFWQVWGHLSLWFWFTLPWWLVIFPHEDINTYRCRLILLGLPSQP